MTQVPTGSHLRTYFSIEIMRTSQRHPNIWKPLCILTIPKSKTNLALKMTMTPKNLRKPSLTVRSKIPSSIIKRSRRDTVFTGRSFGNYATSLVREWKVYYSLCFGIVGGDARVSAPFHIWGVDGFWSVLCCAESLRDWGVFFILVQVRLCDVKNIP